MLLGQREAGLFPQMLHVDFNKKELSCIHSINGNVLDSKLGPLCNVGCLLHWWKQTSLSFSHCLVFSSSHCFIMATSSYHIFLLK